MRRLLLTLLVALGLSPGLFWHPGLPPRNHDQEVAFERLTPPDGPPDRTFGESGLKFAGSWRLTSPNDDFGSYSALVATGDGALLAFSDRGKFLRFRLPVTGTRGVALGQVFPGDDTFKPEYDVESAARDPATGRIWLALESRNAIIRLQPDLSDLRSLVPKMMRGWPVNQGAEAMVRLHDGQFIMLSESRLEQAGMGRPALLFGGDPVERAAAIGFRFVPPPGFAPSDMVELPDGRALILLRGLEFGLPPRFTARLVLADPMTIRPDEAWEWRPLADLGGSVPMDNYEGLAVTGGENGAPLTLWLVSDDNSSLVVQQTLLTRLDWDVPARKQAPENPRAPN